MSLEGQSRDGRHHQVAGGIISDVQYQRTRNLHMLSRFPLEVRSITSDSNSVLVEDVNSSRCEALGDPSRRQDPETVENEYSCKSGGSVERPDSDTTLNDKG